MNNEEGVGGGAGCLCHPRSASPGLPEINGRPGGWGVAGSGAGPSASRPLQALQPEKGVDSSHTHSF